MPPPDWAGASTLNLIATLAHASGAQDWPCPGLRAVDAAALGDVRTLVLLIVDGLGSDYLAEHGAGGALAGAQIATLDAVVPSTTASAITTCMTGQAPGTHGLVGWFVHDDALGGTVCPLPATRRGGGALDAQTCAALYTAPALYGALARQCHVVQPRHIAHSTYTRHHSAGAHTHAYAGLAGLVDCVTRLAATSGPAQLVYAYWPELDHLGHTHGMDSPAARAHLREVDGAVATLAAALRDCDAALLVSADHGFVDVPPARVLRAEQAPAVAAALRAPLSGEPRLAFAHVHAHCVDDFPARVAAAWGGAVGVVPSAQLMAGGHFGPGAAHPHLAARLGDFALLPEPGFMLRHTPPGEREFPLVGVHGGFTPAERRVPLCVFRPRGQA